jgi:mannan endo-1,4-beta-mannosidase
MRRPLRAKPSERKPAAAPQPQSDQPSRRDVLRGVAVAAGTLAIEACAHGTAAGPVSAGGGSGGGAPAPSSDRRWLPGGLEVRGKRFYRDGKPFFVNGFNYWSSLPLSREGNTAGWDQVRRDLDALQGMGINMLRIIGGTEGPDTEPLRIVPSLQPAQGKYDAPSVAGLLRLTEELNHRKLYAIVMMNNFWHWSGGMAQYLAWAGAGPMPYPPPHPGGSWDTYQKTTAQFYSNGKATQAYADFLRYMVPQMSNNPAVIWELANEPRGINNVKPFVAWVDETARLIRSMAPGQLVTTGSEGQTASASYAGVDVERDHASPFIDFITFHLWAENWGWVHEDNVGPGLPKALDRARAYIDDHAKRATRVGKPLLLEEFGYPRDAHSFAADSPVTIRDKYFDEIYGLVNSLKATSPMAGIMPWAWAGDARPPRPGEFWKPGDPFIGDPPHEKQGWYSVYDKDSTVELIKGWSARLVA